MFNKTTELVKAQYVTACIENSVCIHMAIPCDQCGICSDPECTWEHK